MYKSDIIRFLVLRSIGNFFLLFSLFGVAATFGPTLFYEVQFRIGQYRGVRYTVVAESPLGRIIDEQRKEKSTGGGGLANVIAGLQEQILIPKDPHFSILIPKVGANTKVFENVDPANEEEFLPILQKGVAHAKGTVFPGMKGNIYLFAHSTDNFWDVGRYNAVFYLLKDVVPGDEIVLFFENKRHNYVVTEQKVIDSEDVSYMLKSQAQDKETLILQTCWPPGTTWKRLLVLAKPK